MSERSPTNKNSFYNPKNPVQSAGKPLHQDADGKDEEGRTTVIKINESRPIRYEIIDLAHLYTYYFPLPIRYVLAGQDASTDEQGSTVVIELNPVLPIAYRRIGPQPSNTQQILMSEIPGAGMGVHHGPEANSSSEHGVPNVLSLYEEDSDEELPVTGRAGARHERVRLSDEEYEARSSDSDSDGSLVD